MKYRLNARATTPIETWQDLVDALKARGYKDGGMYVDSIGFWRPYSPDEDDIEITPSTPIWEGTCWIACYWVPGNSEGYYVHIDRIPSHDRTKRKSLILAKCWCPQVAEALTARAQRIVNQWY